jgi:hypothetical protein
MKPLKPLAKRAMERAYGGAGGRRPWRPLPVLEIYDSTFLEGRNRRRHPRRRTRMRAWADPGGVAPVYDCVVLDVSEGGASVVSVTGVDLPDSFELQLDAHRSMGKAEVAWRDGAAVGVKLAGSK